jgi:UDP-galactopyranose mutase
MSIGSHEQEVSLSRRVAVVGAGWSGAVTARLLQDTGFRVDIFEQAGAVGGHARAEVLNGVVYEPNGAHIFHTSNPRVAEFVQRFGLVRPYEHIVVTEVFLDESDDEGHILSWPPQVDELKALPLWGQIAKELNELPSQPSGEDFESYSTSLMGPTLYRLFIEGYTIKQWGRRPRDLSSRFAPKRIDLRRDGYRRLFRDTWEFFGPEGVNSVIESILAPVGLTCGATIAIADLEQLASSFDAVVLTGALDEFVGESGTLEWRGITMHSTYLALDDPGAKATPAYVVNRPSLRVPYTRTVETKHATGQMVRGTVVSEEFPVAGERHYPVYKLDGSNERRNAELKQTIVECSPVPIYFCGRLANYAYINQDQAIEQAMACAETVARDLSA